MHDLFGSLDQARARIEALVEKYTLNRDHYRASSYNEETARNDFVSPFFEALGWDISNRDGLAPAYRDVIHEEGIKIGDGTKAPDYTFRVGGQRKFFVEAKKPFVDLRRDPLPAYQLRRYAWSAKLPLSVLTDFEEFAVYDTRKRPEERDKAAVARIQLLTFEEYLPKLEEVWKVFSKEAVYRGSFDRYAEETLDKRGTSEVDTEFLKELERWREELARNVALRNTNLQLSVDQLNFAVQTTIDRILFLRIAEGRGIEEYGHLLALANGEQIYSRLVRLFHKADLKYNSGLFDFKADELTPELEIDDKTLRTVLGNLYYPQSPYEFSVLPPEILGNVYEQFLGKVIRLTPGGRAKVEEKAEAKKAGGVYYTPTYIVDYIVKNTVGKLCEAKSPRELAKLRILDPACGSGSFLLVAFQTLLDAHLAWYRSHDPKKHRKAIFLGPGGEWRLTTAEKRRILLDSIYGVDIDPQAVEVTKLSLLLRVLEGENAETLKQQLLFGERALPPLEGNIKCGNALIGLNSFERTLFPDPEELRRINPFDWQREFPEILKAGGFNAVIGNPPYLNVDDTWGRGDLRLTLLRDSYPEVYNDKTDLLFYFLARGLALSRDYLSFIVSRAFLEAYKADKLRKHLAERGHVVEVIDFQNFYVFPKVGITTCIVTLRKVPGDKLQRYAKLRGTLHPPFELERSLKDPGSFETIPIRTAALSAAPWVFVTEEQAALFAKLDSAGQAVADVLLIGKGMETGRNDVFGGRTEEEIRAWRVPSGMFFKRAANSDIRRYRIVDRGEFVLYLENVAHFKDLPGGVREHLQTHSTELRARAAYIRGDCEWWKFTWPLHKEWYSRTRILCPYLANANRFALDGLSQFLGLTDTTVLFDNGQPEDLRYFLALLNSRLLTLRFRSIGKLKSGGIYEFFWNSVSKLPLRRIQPRDLAGQRAYDGIVSLVDRMTDLQRRLQGAKTGHDRELIARQIGGVDRDIDRLVYELYEVTPEEITLVERATDRAG